MRFRPILISLVAAAHLGAQDARDIISRSLATDSRYDRESRNYTYRILNTSHDLDKAGNVRQSHTVLEEVMFLGGRRTSRVLEKDGKPLSPRDEKKEAEKLDRAFEEARKITPDERQRREAEAERRRLRERERLQDIPLAFDFKLLGEEIIAGRQTWRIAARPHPGYNGQYAFLLKNLEGTVWIDQRDYAWVKVEANVLNNISIGLFLARVGKGSRLAFESTRINDQLWAPKHLALRMSGRVAVLKKLSADEELDFSDYRKFRSDARIIPAAEDQ